MENLNAEQVKKALECCAAAHSSYCRHCPIDIKKQENCECGTFLAGQALALINSQEQRIKELTEDNEYLKTQVTATEARYESRKESDLEEVLELRLKVEELTEENERLRVVADMSDTTLTDALRIVNEFCDARVKRARADTVRKMLSLLHEKKQWARNDNCDMEVVDIDDIDQIAKEMLEGENEN